MARWDISGTEPKRLPHCHLPIRKRNDIASEGNNVSSADKPQLRTVNLASKVVECIHQNPHDGIEQSSDPWLTDEVKTFVRPSSEGSGGAADQVGQLHNEPQRMAVENTFDTLTNMLGCADGNVQQMVVGMAWWLLIVLPACWGRRVTRCQVASHTALMPLWAFTTPTKRMILPVIFTDSRHRMQWRQ
ncbi:hypothetical protein K491DRAFT_681678 [Lophiostoma macrostomum CBS 122681]|uniref:Uncharacterized protein n=1 Tax=Lophiostoma macrostomum CBS 122681 TaxID=1314788 RepID=A0A6A6SWE5_9PLEO|nr:hypothetical protein K491DRAFT_681678 [Lophiostoma macrostomum CBS 122681]